MTWRERHSLEHSDINLKTLGHINIGTTVKSSSCFNTGCLLESPRKLGLPITHAGGSQASMGLFYLQSRLKTRVRGAGLLKVECASESTRTVLNHRTLGPTPRFCDSIGLGGGRI